MELTADDTTQITVDLATPCDIPDVTLPPACRTPDVSMTTSHAEGDEMRQAPGGPDTGERTGATRGTDVSAGFSWSSSAAITRGSANKCDRSNWISCDEILMGA